MWTLVYLMSSFVDLSSFLLLLMIQGTSKGFIWLLWDVTPYNSQSWIAHIYMQIPAIKMPHHYYSSDDNQIIFTYLFIWIILTFTLITTFDGKEKCIFLNFTRKFLIQFVSWFKTCILPYMYNRGTQLNFCLAISRS